MRISRRELEARNRRQAAHIDELIADLDKATTKNSARAAAQRKLAAELDACKEIVATVIVAAGHPSTVVHDVRTFADSLREALAANGVDLRLELARLEGADL